MTEKKSWRWLLGAIRLRLVRWYHWKSPVAWHRPTHVKVTARVRELVAAGLATIPEPEIPGGWVLVELTDAGHAWLDGGRS